MNIKTLFQGLLAVYLLNGFMAAMPANAEPMPKSSKELIAQMSGKLSEESLNQALAALQKAEEQEDMEAMMRYIAPFVTSEITVESIDDSLTMRLQGKQEHRDLISSTFERITNREILTREAEVTIMEEDQLGVATIVTVKNITTQDGKRYLSSSTDVLRFALIDNQPMIVSITSRGWIAERPAQ